jgi:hypothetical protein
MNQATPESMPLRGDAMTDDAFVASFEDCGLDAASFHQADRVRMALLYLRRYPVLEAIERFSGALARFAAANGKPDRYNETVTWAFLLIIRERIARTGGAPGWRDFAAANRDLLNWNGDILKRYYREETLSSGLAKRIFLLPDRITAQTVSSCSNANAANGGNTSEEMRSDYSPPRAIG